MRLELYIDITSKVGRCGTKIEFGCNYQPGRLDKSELVNLICVVQLLRTYDTMYIFLCDLS